MLIQTPQIQTFSKKTSISVTESYIYIHILAFIVKKSELSFSVRCNQALSTCSLGVPNDLYVAFRQYHDYCTCQGSRKTIQSIRVRD